MQVTREAI